MNSKRFLILFLLIGLLIKSQKKAITIEYKNNISSQDVGTLYCNDSGSLYIIKKINRETAIKNFPDGTTLYPANTDKNIANKPRFIYFENKTKSFYTNIINQNQEIIIKDITTAKWETIAEKKIILGYTCQKAKGEYYGKKYTAWYTTQLPFSFGPLKLTGLPGTILELVSEDGNTNLIATSVNTKVEKNTAETFISKYDFSKTMSLEQYNEWYDKQIQNFEEKINNQMPVSNKITFKKNCKNCNH